MVERSTTPARGLMHIYCGDGKGKTTAGVGLCTRAAGAGKTVRFTQFLKSGNSSELGSLERLGVRVTPSNGPKKFIFNMTEAEKAACAAESEQLLRDSFALAAAEDCDLLVLDELCAAVSTGMVPLTAVVELIGNRPEKLELVVTGRGPAPELLALADYVSEIRKVRHPYDQGVNARRGIEF